MSAVIEPKIRRRPNYQAIRNELKFVTSPNDLRYFVQKSVFLLPRVLNTVDRWTKTPPSIQIEPTNACFLNCITCCRSASVRSVGYMEMDLFRKIILDAAQNGIKRVQLFIMGEPLMHPHIVEMIRFIKSFDMGFHLTTNGALLNEKMGKEILSAGVTSADYITFSILGFTKEVHEQVMRGIKHEKVIQNIDALLENRKSMKTNGPLIETVFYGIPENIHEVEPFLKYWEKRVDHAIYAGKAVEAFIDQSLPTTPRKVTCTLIWERMAVLWNGDVVICGEDMDGKYVVGNLRDSNIHSVWNGEILQHYKKIHKEKQYQKIPLCEFCDW